MSIKKSISVVILVTERADDLLRLVTSYKNVLEATGYHLEFICVLDGKFAHLESEIRKLDAGSHAFRVFTLSRTFGESAALSLAVERAEYDLLMTLPSYEQVEVDQLSLLFDRIDEADLVIARRWPRRDSFLNRLSSRIFHLMLKSITGVGFRDLGCSVRLFRKRVFDEIAVYGDQHRFLPVLADRRGFRVVEVDIPQSSVDSDLRMYSPGVYVSRLLDLMGVFFLARFTKKPLRFFGMVGSVLAALGVIILFVTVAQRYFFDMALADRPLLLLGSMFVVLGVQLFALGLIGELMIFTHARDLKEYAIQETVNMDDEPQS